MEEEKRCMTWARNWSKSMPEQIVAEKVKDGTIPLDCVREQLSEDTIAELEGKKEPEAKEGEKVVEESLAP